MKSDATISRLDKMQTNRGLASVDKTYIDGQIIDPWHLKLLKLLNYENKNFFRDGTLSKDKKARKFYYKTFLSFLINIRRVEQV